jgi:PAS domain S-box-containing protein
LQIFSVRAAAELERVRSDEARRASEASYRSIFEASEDAIFVHDVDTGAIADVNPKACRAYGYSYEELKRLDVGQLSSGVTPYTLEQAVQRIAKARAGQAQRFEWHSRNKDGSLHWDEVFLKRATIGGVDRILAFTREITERKQAEEALRASEEQYRAIFNASVDALILWSPERRIVDANPASSRMFGYAPEEFPGIDPGRLVPPEGWDTDSVVETREGGETFHMEAKASRKDATTFDVDFHGVQVLYRGRPHMLSIIRDITERRQAEEQRSRLEAQLRQAQKMEAIGHLTGGIAHDFNNILTGVMGYIVLAQERAERFGDTKLPRYLERAQQSGQRARDLIQQMLTFSRGQRGEPRPVRLAPLVKESVQLLRSTLPSSVEIRTHLDPAAPPALLDPVQVEQVLMNLCINARDAMGGAGRIGVRVGPATYRGTLCASCRQAVDGSFVEIAVRDTGPGIVPDIQERIFEPFFSTKEVGKGSGMGLSMVHGIVHEYGGHLVLDTAPGEGAEFRVLFRPLTSAGEAQTSAAAEDAVAATGPALRGRVLVVDDDDAAGEFMRDLLESWGLEAELIRSSIEAREAVGRDPARFDLAVLDQTMPRLTGLELSREILAVRPGMPVILYTGYSERLSDQQIASAGVRALVRKPVDVHELFALLQDLLAGTAAW